MVNKPLALAAAAVVAGLLGFGSVEAANVATGSVPVPTLQTAPDANIQPAAHRRYYRYGGNRNYYRGGRNYRSGRYYRGNRYYYGGGRYWGGYGGYGNYYRPYSGLFLGLGFPFFSGGYGGYGGYYGDYPYYNYRPYYYRTAGSSHVRWCLNRYRSYSPRSDTFMGYDGYRHRCRSPYRY